MLPVIMYGAPETLLMGERVVVAHLSRSQFSPRVVRTFLRDGQTQFSLGMFVATFVDAVTVLRGVDSTDGSPFLPAVATTVDVALLLLGVGAFVACIHQVVLPSRSPPSSGPSATKPARCWLAGCPPTRRPLSSTRPRGSGHAVRVVSPTHGVVRTVEAARDADVVLVLLHPLGHLVAAGAPLLDVPARQRRRGTTEAGLPAIGQAPSREQTR